MSAILDVADAVVTSLNGGEFGMDFVAERAYVPVRELSELASLCVTVVPKALAIEPDSRADSDFDCGIDIGVQKRIQRDGLDEVDALVDLVEELGDHLRNASLPDAPAAAFLSLKNEPVFDPDHLHQQRVFTSVLTVVYRVVR